MRIETYRLHQERALDLDREAFNLLDLRGNEDILDVGCGPGRFLRFLSQAGHTGRLVGLDQSAGMVATLNDSQHPISGIIGDAACLPLPANALDVVVARHMLYHVDDIPSAINELARVARETVLISTGSRSSTLYLDSLLARVVADFGYSSETRIMSRFCTENAGEFLDAAGLNYREMLFDNALVFRSAEPVVRYVLSCLPSFGILPGSDRYRSTSVQLNDMVEADVVASGGQIRDPSGVGFYIVRKK